MSGRKAVENGLAFEARVYTILSTLAGVKIIKNIPYPSIYSAFASKHKTIMEFRAQNMTLSYLTLDRSGNTISKTRTFKNLNIECKYQEKSGSIDEKYPLVYQNALISDAEVTLFIYADPQKKIKSGAIEYIKHSALHSGERLIVLDIMEFIKVIKKNYPTSESDNVNLEPLTITANAIAQYEHFEKKHYTAFKACISNNDLYAKFKSYMAEQKEFYFFVNDYGVKNRDYLPHIYNLQKIRSIIAQKQEQYLQNDLF